MFVIYYIPCSLFVVRTAHRLDGPQPPGRLVHSLDYYSIVEAGPINVDGRPHRRTKKGRLWSVFVFFATYARVYRRQANIIATMRETWLQDFSARDVCVCEGPIFFLEDNNSSIRSNDWITTDRCPNRQTVQGRMDWQPHIRSLE